MKCFFFFCCFPFSNRFPVQERFSSCGGQIRLLPLQHDQPNLHIQRWQHPCHSRKARTGVLHQRRPRSLQERPAIGDRGDGPAPDRSIPSLDCLSTTIIQGGFSISGFEFGGNSSHGSIGSGFRLNGSCY